MYVREGTLRNGFPKWRSLRGQGQLESFHSQLLNVPGFNMSVETGHARLLALIDRWAGIGAGTAARRTRCTAARDPCTAPMLPTCRWNTRNGIDRGHYPNHFTLDHILLNAANAAARLVGVTEPFPGIPTVHESVSSITFPYGSHRRAAAIGSCWQPWWCGERSSPQHRLGRHPDQLGGGGGSSS